MKNLLLIFALACSSPLFSQRKEIAVESGPIQKFSLTFLTGLNINQMPYKPNTERFEGRGSHNSRLMPEIAYFAGISARQALSKRLAFKIDGQFSIKGYGLKNAPPLEHYQAYYLDFVPQLEYNFLKKCYISLGGYGGIRMEEHMKFQGQNWSKIDDRFVSFAEKTDWGLASGCRVAFGRVSVLVKYQHGLTPAIKLQLQDDIGNIENASQFHRTLQVGLGFKIL